MSCGSNRKNKKKEKCGYKSPQEYEKEYLDSLEVKVRKAS